MYLNGSDLAKIGYLYLNDGVGEGQRIVSSEWVKQSLTPSFQDDELDIVGGKVVGVIPFKYGECASVVICCQASFTLVGGTALLGIAREALLVSRAVVPGGSGLSARDTRYAS